MSVHLKLILMRHGEARQEGSSDKARALSTYGVSQAQEAGRQLQKTLTGCDRAIVSDAGRTRQTAEHVLTTFIAKETNSEPLLYTAGDSETFTEALSRNILTDDRVVLVIGHNPIISGMASSFSGAHYAFSPADYLILTIEAENWLTALNCTGCWTAVC